MTVDAAQGLLDRLRQRLGPDHVLRPGEADLSAWTVDWRKRYRGHPLALVRPADAAEVAAVMRACAAVGVAVVPQGGNTGLVGGGVPDASGTQILLNLGRLNRIRQIDAANLTMTVEAGCILQTVQQAAAAEGLLFPLSLAAEGSCTLGGNLASNAGGTAVLRYGNARELCLGLEVVTPQGELWSGLGGLRKDNTGYDLRDLYIGSEGTLGILTAATLKLFPAPAAQTTALAACASLAAAVALLGRARAALGAALTGFEVMNAAALDLVAHHFPALPRPFAGGAWPAWTVLIEQSEAGAPDEPGEAAAARATARFEALLAGALERGTIGDAVVASSLAQSRSLWALREHIPLAQAEAGLNIKHDIALPVSRIPAFVEANARALATACPGSTLICFGHLGDGNLHHNLQAPAGVDAPSFLLRHEARVNDLVHDAVQAAGGSFSAEHGIGALKCGELGRRKDSVALALMRRLKQALDPLNLMNPGRLLPPG